MNPVFDKVYAPPRFSGVLPRGISKGKLAKDGLFQTNRALTNQRIALQPALEAYRRVREVEASHYSAFAPSELNNQTVEQVGFEHQRSGSEQHEPILPGVDRARSQPLLC